MELKRLEIHEIHVESGAKMTPFAGYEMPVRYTSEMEEHKIVRSGVGIFDVSHMGQFIIEGPEAWKLIQAVSSNDCSKLETGQAQYSCLTNEQGGIIDDLLTYRLEDQKYMLVVNAANTEKDWVWINEKNTFDAAMTDISDELCLFAVQGPLAAGVLQKLTDVDLKGMKYYTFVVGELGGIDNMIISATGYTGSGGFELYVQRDKAKQLWQDIMQAGKKSGIRPIGLAARNTLRLEMGFCLYGEDLTEDTTPLEAGLSWVVKLNKGFTGSDQLAAQKERGITRRLVGFEMIDKGIPRHGYEIFNENEARIGYVTSGSLSPSLGVGIGMGYVETAYSKTQTKVFIQVRNKKMAAEIVKLPFYKKG